MLNVNDQETSLLLTLNKYLPIVYRKILLQSFQNNMLLSKKIILPHDHILLGIMNQQLNETNFLQIEFHVLHKVPRQNQEYK